MSSEFGKAAVLVNDRIAISAFSKFSIFSVFGFVELSENCFSPDITNINSLDARVKKSDEEANFL